MCYRSPVLSLLFEEVALVPRPHWKECLSPLCIREAPRVGPVGGQPVGEPTRVCPTDTTLSFVHAVEGAPVRSGWGELGQVISLKPFSDLHQLVDM